MAKRQSKVIITDSFTPDAVEGFLSEYTKADSKIKKILAENELKINKIRQATADDIQSLVEVKTKYFDMVQHYALTNPELFKDKKSIEFSHAKFGFRTSNPSVVMRKGYKTEAVLELCGQFKPEWIRTKVELDKEKILQMRFDEGIDDVIKTIGVEIKQDETFFVEPKSENID
jgi:phage host-nuclease inhibitor protein Gam